MKKLLFIIVLLTSPVACLAEGLAADEFVWAVSADEWARPRSAEVILTMEPVVQSVRLWMQSPGHQLLIKHPGGEEGLLWGEELKDWLVSLGVSSSDVRTIPGHARNDELIIVLRRRGDL